jgi:hypothetical protein
MATSGLEEPSAIFRVRERNNRRKEGMALRPFSELLGLTGLFTALFQTSLHYRQLPCLAKDGSRRFFWNTGNYLLGYKASHPRQPVLIFTAIRHHYLQIKQKFHAYSKKNNSSKKQKKESFFSVNHVRKNSTFYKMNKKTGLSQ